MIDSAIRHTHQLCSLSERSCDIFLPGQNMKTFWSSRSCWTKESWLLCKPRYMIPTTDKSKKFGARTISIWIEAKSNSVHFAYFVFLFHGLARLHTENGAGGYPPDEIFEKLKSLRSSFSDRIKWSLLLLRSKKLAQSSTPPSSYSF